MANGIFSSTNENKDKYFIEIKNLKSKVEAQILGEKLLKDDTLKDEGFDLADQMDLISVLLEKIEKLEFEKEGSEWMKLLSNLEMKWWTIRGYISND